VASGYVDRDCQLVWRAELGDQAFQRLPEVRHRGLGTVTFAMYTHAWPESCVSAPNTVLILLDGVGDMNGTAHETRLLRRSTSTCIAHHLWVMSRATPISGGAAIVIGAG